MNLKLLLDEGVEEKLNQYPEDMKAKIQFLYDLIIDVAEEIPEIHELKVALKWGQLSFISEIGSTLRIDTIPKRDNEYAMFFHCQSRLVETFELVFKDTFRYQGNRAIVFQVNDEIPVDELKECVKATLTYHKVKKLDTLGIMAY